MTRNVSLPRLGTGGPVASNVAKLLRHLLQLTSDDPQLAQLAAAAVLVAREGRSAAGARGWSTQEMDEQRAEVRRLEAAWSSFLSAAGAHEIERALGAAALHLAFREMEEAVRGGAPIPARDELLVRVARALLGNDFTTSREVEAAVGAMLAGASAGCSTLAEDALTCLAAGQARRGSFPGTGGLARATALVSSMLAC